MIMAVNVDRRLEQDDVEMLRRLRGSQHVNVSHHEYAVFNYIHLVCHAGDKGYTARPHTQILLLADGRINFRSHWSRYGNANEREQHREFSGPHGSWYLLHAAGSVQLVVRFSWQGIGGTMRTTRLSFNGESKKWIGHTAARPWEMAVGSVQRRWQRELADKSPTRIDEVQMWFREMRGQGRLELQEEPHTVREALRSPSDRMLAGSFLAIQDRMLAVGPQAAPDRQQAKGNKIGGAEGQGQGQEQGLYCRRVPSNSTQPTESETRYCTGATLPLAHPTPDAEFLRVADRGEAWQWLDSDIDIVYV